MFETTFYELLSRKKERRIFVFYHAITIAYHSKLELKIFIVPYRGKSTITRLLLTFYKPSCFLFENKFETSWILITNAKTNLTRSYSYQPYHTRNWWFLSNQQTTIVYDTFSYLLTTDKESLTTIRYARYNNNKNLRIRRMMCMHHLIHE